MAKSTDRRLSDLEKSVHGGDDNEINCYVSWRTDDLIEDRCHGGELLTVEAWERRHPTDRLIIVTYEDMSGGDDTAEPVPA